MAEMPWSKFFWSDWESDQGLRLCSLSAQGLWMRMLCVCARHEPKGYLSINGNPLKVDAIARLAGVTETEAETLMAELELNGVFSRNRSGCIYSRRMVRDEKRSQEGRKHKKRGLKEAAEKPNENTPPSRGASRGASPQKPEARSQIEDVGGGARTRDPEPTLRERLLWAAGIDPQTIIDRGPGAKGGSLDMAEAERWIELFKGDTDAVVQHVEDIRSGMNDPPGTLRYFTKPLQKIAGAKSAPPLTPIEGSTHERQPSRDRRAVAADDALRERLEGAARNRSPSKGGIRFG